MVSYSNFREETFFGGGVLILIVMDNGLLPAKKKAEADYIIVLILIVMDNGLLLGRTFTNTPIRS